MYLQKSLVNSTCFCNAVKWFQAKKDFLPRGKFHKLKKILPTLIYYVTSFLSWGPLFDVEMIIFSREDNK